MIGLTIRCIKLWKQGFLYLTSPNGVLCDLAWPQMGSRPHIT